MPAFKTQLEALVDQLYAENRDLLVDKIMGAVQQRLQEAFDLPSAQNLIDNHIEGLAKGRRPGRKARKITPKEVDITPEADSCLK